MTLLAIDGLSLSIRGTPILRDLSFGIEAGEILGVIGESGSGKSLTALSIMQLLPGGSQSRGRVLFAGQDLAAAAEPDLCAVRGRDIGTCAAGSSHCASTASACSSACCGEAPSWMRMVSATCCPMVCS
ncbi:MAG: ATP-binding cassette domain-containing protein, partial [Pseudomonadota bacterium]|nr:ATP-binding cassette domain-containing protein [Pseudomonadota bacterium]